MAATASGDQPRALPFCLPVSPAVLRPDGFVVKGGGGGDLVVPDVTVLHAQRLHALVGVGGASHLDIWFSEYE